MRFTVCGYKGRISSSTVGVWEGRTLFNVGKPFLLERSEDGLPPLPETVTCLPSHPWTHSTQGHMQWVKRHGRRMEVIHHKDLIWRLLRK